MQSNRRLKGEYRKLTDTHTSIVDLLVMPEAADVEFETERAVMIHRTS